MPSWFEVTIDVPVDLSEVMASYLLDLGSPGLEYVEGDGITSLVGYFRDRTAIDRLRKLCAQMRLEAGQGWPPVIHSRVIDEEDWAEDWKRHFRPTPVGRRLQICPPWDTGGAPERVTLIIHPGMAFGTGQHATTRGCLELIEETVAERDIARALDVGTGSGILSIALAKLGVAEVYAFDSDPQACAIAAENSERNGTGSAVTVTDDWRKIRGPFDLIVANLFTDLLREFAEKLQGLLAPNGQLLCSGFLAADEPLVVAAYPRLAVVRRREEEGWVTLLLATDGSAR